MVTVAHISADGDDTTADRPGVAAAGMQAPVSQHASRHMRVL